MQLHVPYVRPGQSEGVRAHSLESSVARPAAATTAFMKAARTPAFSSSCTPEMVVPPGDVTCELPPPNSLLLSLEVYAGAHGAHRASPP